MEGELERWVYFLKEGNRMSQEEVQGWRDPEVQRAYEELERLSRDPEIWRVYESRLKGILDYQAALHSTHKEGREEGKKEQARAIALKMLGRGLPQEEICEITGLSPEEIEGLRQGQDLP